MKNLILLVIVLTVYLSCKQQSNHHSNDTFSVESVIQRFDELTEFSYKVDQIWNGPIPGSIDTIGGSCSFIKQKNDTLIGAYYLLAADKTTMLYNGKTFIRALTEDKSAVIYNLDEYPDPRRRVTSSTLYFLSYNELLNTLKEKVKYNQRSIIILKDTIINNYSRFKLKIVEQDTIIAGNHNENYVTIIFDKETLLPLAAIKTYKSPGEVYKSQTIDATFSNFQFSTSPTKRTIDLSSIPFQIQKLSYATDKQTIPTIKINDIAPFWSGISINGDSISSINQAGKITLLDFTSVHCGACLLVNKILNRIDEKYSNSKLTLISVYPLDKIDEIKYLTVKSNISHSSLYNATKMQKDYGVEGFPNLFLINQTGKIEYVAFHYSDKLESELTETIDRLLIKN
jgi:thiol-disulfide isomerase/thioredoxin